MYHYVCNRIKRLKSIKLKNKVQLINSGKSYKIYFVLDENKEPISWLYLYRKPNWKAWEVYQIWTFPEHRGKGLAKQLYKAAINDDGILLASGNLHTQYSQALWKNFLKKKLFNVWAQDFKNLSSVSLVEYSVEEDAIESDLPIYSKSSSRESAKTDIRFLAIKNVSNRN